MEMPNFLKYSELEPFKQAYILGEITYTQLIVETSKVILDTNECVDYVNTAQTEKCQIALALNQDAEA